LKTHDEEGVASDPRFGEQQHILNLAQQWLTLPTVQNSVELENHLLESLRARGDRCWVRVPVDALSKTGCETRSGHGYTVRPFLLRKSTTKLGQWQPPSYLQAAWQPAASAPKKKNPRGHRSGGYSQ